MLFPSSHLEQVPRPNFLGDKITLDIGTSGISFAGARFGNAAFIFVESKQIVVGTLATCIAHTVHRTKRYLMGHGFINASSN